MHPRQIDPEHAVLPTSPGLVDSQSASARGPRRFRATSHREVLDHPEWMDLKAAEGYACVSERTFREWIHLPENPLPAVQVANGKLLVKRSELDRWLAAHPYRSADGVDVGRIVDDVVGGLKRTA